MTTLLPVTTDIIRAFGWTLLHSFWQAFFVYACLRIVLKIWPMASAAIKYHLSFLSLAGIAGWFLVTFFNQLNAIKEAQKIQEMAMAWDPATIAAAMEQLPQRSNGLQMMLPGMESYFPFLVAVYIIGVTLMTIKLCLDLAQLRQMRQEGISAMGATWDGHLLKLAVSMGVTRKVELFISQHLQVPVMIGFLKPVILLPAAMVSNLSPEQLEAILLHELAHIKRNDYLLNIFQSIVETILFFNPFVWWISKNIRLEREHCCDDLVIAGTVQPLHYARALVALEEYRLTANPMAMAAADDKHHLLHRIKRIMEMKTKNLNYSQRVLALLIIVVGLVSIAWLNPGNKSEKKEKQPSLVMASDTIPIPPTPPPAPVAPPAAKELPPPPEPLPAPLPPLKSSTFNAPPMAPMPPLTPMAAMAPMAPPTPPLPPAPMAYVPGSYYTAYSSFNFDGDTTTPRSRKIIVKGEDGVEKEYNSIAEMPEADRKRMEENYIRMQQQYADVQKHYQKAFNYNYNFKYNLKNNESLKKALKEAEEAIKKTDWSKMGKDFEVNFKKLDWDKMNREMRENFKKIDWDKAKMDINSKMNQIQFEKLKEEIKLNFNQADWEKVNKELKESLKKIDWEKIEKDIKKSSEDLYRKYGESFQEGTYNGSDDARAETLRSLASQQAQVDKALAESRRAMASQNASRNEAHREAARARAGKVIAEQRDLTEKQRADYRDKIVKTLAEQDAANKELAKLFRDEMHKKLAEQRAEASRHRTEISRDQAEQRMAQTEQRRVDASRRAKEAEERHKALNDMLDGMQKDNLLDREKDFEIEKKGDDLYINGKKQSADINKKYEQYLKNKNVTIKKSKDKFQMHTEDNR